MYYTSLSLSIGGITRVAVDTILVGDFTKPREEDTLFSLVVNGSDLVAASIALTFLNITSVLRRYSPQNNEFINTGTRVHNNTIQTIAAPTAFS